MAVVSERIANATLARLKLYDSIRGVAPTIPFWDVVLLIAADYEQHTSFDLQIKEKTRRNELPVTRYMTINDTETTGLGATLFNGFSALWTRYGEKLSGMKVLIIPVAGYSKRLPIASCLGKIFTAMPFGDQMYDMLDAKLASLIEFPARMDSGIFITSADSIELYACSDLHDWRFPSSGITALGHPSPIDIGMMHGVFVLAQDHVTECKEKVEVIECLKVLQKKSKEELQENGACLHPSFAQAHGVDDEMVLVDSGFLVNYETVSKLVAFYRDEWPFQCAFDSQMIFQVIGPQAATNVDHMTRSLNKIDEKAASAQAEMIHKVSRLLKNTPLNVLVQSYSAFYHIGTSCEYLEHLSKGSELGQMLGFKRNTFNKKLDNKELNGEETQTSNNSSGDVRACVMHSLLPEHFDWSHSCIVEYCDIRGSVSIQDNAIMSNCCIRPPAEGGLRVIPSHTVLHTACVKTTDNPYVTFVFDVRDDMKQVVPRSDVGNMIFLGKRFKEIFGGDVNEVYDTIFPHKKVCSLWHAKLFKPSTTMDEAFDAALSLLDKVSAGNESFELRGCLSMADIVKQKDVSAMLAYRRGLKECIVE